MVSLPDAEARYGRSPFPPKLPFMPGYAIVAAVDAVGEAFMALIWDADALAGVSGVARYRAEFDAAR